MTARYAAEKTKRTNKEKRPRKRKRLWEKTIDELNKLLRLREDECKVLRDGWLKERDRANALTTELARKALAYDNLTCAIDLSKQVSDWAKIVAALRNRTKVRGNIRKRPWDKKR